MGGRPVGGGSERDHRPRERVLRPPHAHRTDADRMRNAAPLAQIRRERNAPPHRRTRFRGADRRAGGKSALPDCTKSLRWRGTGDSPRRGGFPEDSLRKHLAGKGPASSDDAPGTRRSEKPVTEGKGRSREGRKARKALERGEDDGCGVSRLLSGGTEHLSRTGTASTGILGSGESKILRRRPDR